MDAGRVLLGEETKGVHMPWSEHAEVPVVERRQLRLAKPFDDREDGGVDEADVGIGVAITQLTDSPVVLRQQILDVKDPVRNVVQQGDHDAR